jgi:hypothetical protein
MMKILMVLRMKMAKEKMMELVQLQGKGNAMQYPIFWCN